MVHSVRNASLKYFALRPFILEPGVRTGLKIRYRNPLEVGSDRIAGRDRRSQALPGQERDHRGLRHGDDDRRTDRENATTSAA